MMSDRDYFRREPRATRGEWAVMFLVVVVLYGMIYLGIAALLGLWPL